MESDNPNKEMGSQEPEQAKQDPKPAPTQTSEEVTKPQLIEIEDSEGVVHQVTEHQARQLMTMGMSKAKEDYEATQATKPESEPESEEQDPAEVRHAAQEKRVQDLEKRLKVRDDNDAKMQTFSDMQTAIRDNGIENINSPVAKSVQREALAYQMLNPNTAIKDAVTQVVKERKEMYPDKEPEKIKEIDANQAAKNLMRHTLGGVDSSAPASLSLDAPITKEEFRAGKSRRLMANYLRSLS